MSYLCVFVFLFHFFSLLSGSDIGQNRIQTNGD